MSNPYATYPSVPHTASINGFADRIYDQLPACAQPCVRESTSSTPCPYWDTGCLCVIPAFTSAVGECIAENCSGQDVTNAESLAVSICSSAGVWEPYWILPASVSDELSQAAAANRQVETETSSTASETSVSVEATTTSAPVETTSEEAPVSSAAPAETSAAEQSAIESSAASEDAAVSSAAPAETSSISEQSSAVSESASVSASESAESVSVALVNGANTPAIALGGIVACLALI